MYEGKDRIRLLCADLRLIYATLTHLLLLRFTLGDGDKASGEKKKSAAQKVQIAGRMNAYHLSAAAAAARLSCDCTPMQLQFPSDFISLPQPQKSVRSPPCSNQTDCRMAPSLAHTWPVKVSVTRRRSETRQLGKG